MFFNKLFKRIFLLILLFIFSELYAEKSIFLVDKMSVASSIGGSLDTPDLPSSSVESFDGDDKAIFYYARLTIFNPTKKKYDIKMICMDKMGQIFFEKKIEEPYSVSNYQKNNPYPLGSILASFSLNPKPEAIVDNQIKPLMTDKEYFIKLYIDKELMGITKFYYSFL